MEHRKIYTQGMHRWHENRPRHMSTIVAATEAEAGVV